MSYSDEAKENAIDAIKDVKDEIVEALIEKDEAPNSILDYSDGETTESYWMDNWYEPSEAVDLIEELDEHEETDEGLWEGCDWRRMLSAKAALTMRNANLSEFSSLMIALNDDIDVDELREEVRDEMKEAKRPDFLALAGDKLGVEAGDDAVEEMADDLLDKWIEEAAQEEQFDKLLKDRVEKAVDEAIQNL